MPARPHRDGNLPRGPAARYLAGMRAAFRLLLPTTLLLALSACGASEHRLDSFDMEDLPVTAMFQQLSVGLDMPYVLEVPLRSSSPSFDVHLKNVTAREVLAELARRDPSYQCVRRGPVLMMWPTGSAEAASPFSAKAVLEQPEGGVGEVLSRLMNESEQPAEIRAEKVVGRRAVKLVVQDASVRDVLAQVAEQAHAAVSVQPGLVSVQPLKRGVDTTR